MIAKLPKYALWLALALLLWFAVAVFGPKFGMVDWKFALGTMVRSAGPILIAITALVALVALVLALWKGPRGQWWKAALALAIPATLMAGLLSVANTASSVPPIHDVATDTANPPSFSAATMAARQEIGANPVNDYATPLGELDAWKDGMSDSPLASQSHAQIIAESYPELQPIPFTMDRSDAMAQVSAAMSDIGLADIRSDVQAGTVEGTAETFAFGFKDDVVARVGDGIIDLRSVSRVGLSDLGYNAARLRELSEAIEARLGE
ncbi:DUF1499 domain-containing protein [Qipengyuania aurantiaca]|uniref:DUF1499 domain-containing protein n=1 Tax=Qipengyuania aurantiaca TaxID=2867233 RepID=A0ABX8ZLI8_9SPHN|nr:DUF1499 domain-containing protein [Qipengyuania aurantiaca]QZD88999.1 DUF1499 domain-containing protein [Qipengyuania aurantiaca]